jgi:hypothetical protein
MDAEKSKKKYDTEIRELKAKLTALQKPDKPHQRSQESAISELNKKNTALATAAESSRKKYETELNTLKTQIVALQKEGKNQQVTSQDETLTALKDKNTALIADAKNSHKKYETEISTLQKQITDLKQKGKQELYSQNSTVSDLQKQNAQLLAAVATSGKKYQDDVSAKGMQITALQKKAEQDQLAQNDVVNALKQKNAALVTEADTHNKNYEADINALNVRIADLNKKAKPSYNDLPLNDKNGKYAYSLGYFFHEDMTKSLAMFKGRGMNLDMDYVIAGIVDSQRGALKESSKEAYDAIKELNDKANGYTSDFVKKMEHKLKDKTFKKLPGDVFLVVNKKGTHRYHSGDKVTYSMTERVVDGKVIMKTNNAHVIYNEALPQFLREVLDSGLNGGEVAVYGAAESLYTPSTMPKGVAPDTSMEIVFQIHRNP